jgi:hypothetical protein
MKKLFIILSCSIGFIFFLVSCKNQINEFPDFDYTTGYFPYQYPVRTIELGKDVIWDNTSDNNHKFLISAAMGGVYENTIDREFTVELAGSLCNNVLFASTKDTIRLMPQSYYTLSSSKITIPAGKVNGGVEVQLNDNFFNDPLSIKLKYVIPLRIINVTNIDTILRGKALVNNPNPLINTNWSVLPKDFTMFAVKFINPYHGTYLHRGISTVDSSSIRVETNVYRQKYVENDELWSLSTRSLRKVTLSGGSRSRRVAGFLQMDLTFSDDGNCTIAEAAGSGYTITGSGKLVSDADSWGNKKRDAIYLKYQIKSGVYSFSASDTLVVRDRGVVMEVFQPQVFTK